ncbi:ROK family protein [Cetobacterium sp. 8H]|uniref:ROK family protein n=1 Tax=Cetobacterium sp. 8H TaxID=2759681 RepID=UPI00163C719D|nr:ROK family protein [Cetobacterium sp. 8H]MBC2851332.1 ROK family protein [Cetobacterium sp. 8H]
MNYFAGVDIGGTNTKIGVLNSEGDILKSTSIKTESIMGVDYTLNKIWGTIQNLLEELEIDEIMVKGIGMGIPGPVIDRKIVGFFANFPWDKNINISEKMEKISGVKTRLDNDVNVIALGETLYGAGKGFSKSVTIALGTGIGGGIFIDGKLVSGATGAGGEIGHMKLEKEGKLCGCGQKGCFETYASATGVIRETLSRLQINKNNSLYKRIDGDLNKLEAKYVFDEAKNGDKFSLDIVDYVSEYLAMGIGNILNVINPEIVILSGGVALAGDILLDKVKEKLPNYALEITVEKLKIRIGELGNDAGIKGASALTI